MVRSEHVLTVAQEIPRGFARMPAIHPPASYLLDSQKRKRFSLSVLELDGKTTDERITKEIPLKEPDIVGFSVRQPNGPAIAEIEQFIGQIQIDQLMGSGHPAPERLLSI